MGSTQANGMADAVKEGMIGLEGALYWHLTANHYPPYPPQMVSLAQRAIGWAQRGEWDRKLRLRPGMTWKGKRSMTVAQVVDVLHLESFLEGEEDDL